jgi:hypothetical protein
LPTRKRRRTKSRSVRIGDAWEPQMLEAPQMEYGT